MNFFEKQKLKSELKNCNVEAIKNRIQNDKNFNLQYSLDYILNLKQTSNHAETVKIAGLLISNGAKMNQLNKSYAIRNFLINNVEELKIFIEKHSRDLSDELIKNEVLSVINKKSNRSSIERAIELFLSTGKNKTIMNTYLDNLKSEKLHELVFGIESALVLNFLTKDFNIDKIIKWDDNIFINKGKSIERIKFFIENGYNYKIRSAEGNTILMGYLCKSHKLDKEMIKFLLELGFDINEKNGRGETAIFFALKNIFELEVNKTIETLIDAGANINLKNVEGHSCVTSFLLDEEGNSSKFEKAKVLVNKGFILSEKEKTLILSKEYNWLSDSPFDLDIFITLGLNPNYKFDNGQTALMNITLDVSWGDEDLDKQIKIINEFIKYGAEVNAIDNDGHSCLYHAIIDDYRRKEESFIGSTQTFHSIKVNLLLSNLLVSHGACITQHDYVTLLNLNEQLFKDIKSWVKN